MQTHNIISAVVDRSAHEGKVMVLMPIDYLMSNAFMMER